MNVRLRGVIGSILAVVVFIGLAACTKQVATDDHIVRRTTDKSFDEVIFELNFAITQRNFRITGRNTIGQGLRARRYTDMPNSEVIHFCNLENAREVLLIDPGFIAQMPCRITAHEQDGKTVISLILLPVNNADERVNVFARKTNAVMLEMVDFVLEKD